MVNKIICCLQRGYCRGRSFHYVEILLVLLAVSSCLTFIHIEVAVYEWHEHTLLATCHRPDDIIDTIDLNVQLSVILPETSGRILFYSRDVTINDGLKLSLKLAFGEHDLYA